jgi:hypothetical protein
MPKLGWVRTVDCSILYFSAQSLLSDLHIIVINVTLITQGHFAFLVMIQNKATSLQKKQIKLKRQVHVQLADGDHFLKLSQNSSM